MLDEQHCANCGAELANDAILCLKCGSAGPSFWDQISKTIYQEADEVIASASTLEDIETVNERLERIESSISRLQDTARRILASQAEGGPFEAKASYAGKLVEFGSYPSEADGTKRPIVWKMIAVEPSRALLISQYVLDCMPFSPAERESETPDSRDYTNWLKSYNYNNSAIRKWLEEDFVNTAFSEEEKVRIDGQPSLISEALWEKTLGVSEEGGLFTDFAAQRFDDVSFWALSDTGNRLVVSVNGKQRACRSQAEPVGVRPTIWIKLD